jgi:tRNA 5-methylaminomethyl-2-thiouridine biosynthesis bifunctional protein
VLITPATLVFAADGTPYSEAYGDVYHSSAGGIEQARHVFLAGNRLPQRWAGRECFTILETGFGQGLNFLATWQAWRDDPRRPRRLHFLSVEKHPFAVADLATLHARYPELACLAAELRCQWPELTAGFHRLAFERGAVTLTLAFGEAIACIPQFVAAPEAIYLDGFSPAKNPELWSAPLLREIAWLTAPGATLATWAVAGQLRENLAQAGFQWQRTSGFAAKREMLVAALPEDRAGASQPDSGAAGRRIAVVGAGLAGALAAERLAGRGFAVTLFERHARPAQETSGNLAAAMLPVLSLDDARLSRLNRAAYLYAQRTLNRLGFGGADSPIRGARSGVLYIARDEVHAGKQREILRRNAFPGSFAQWLATDAAADAAGAPVAGGGWWFPGGAYANPSSLCEAVLAGSSVDCRYGVAVTTAAAEEAGWRLAGADGTQLGHFEQIVLAGATDILALDVSRHLPLFRFRGQVTHLPGTALPGLKAVVCREGYLTPTLDGRHCVGASFHRGGMPELRDEDHQGNLDRLERMVPGSAGRWRNEALDGRVGFRPVSPDKVPIVGRLQTAEAQAQGRDLSAIPRLPGLHVATGYGARGLVWAPLMAEQLACEIIGEPLPIEADLAGAIDPARFVGRTMRERDVD